MFEVIDQKENGDKIQKPPDSSPGFVLGKSGMAGMMLDRHFSDSKTFSDGQNRNKTMKVAIEGDLFGNGPAIGFKATVKVMQGDSGKAGYGPVEDTRRLAATGSRRSRARLHGGRAA